eukprot:14889408-Alexandrium_andersonii.AAC.1
MQISPEAKSACPRIRVKMNTVSSRRRATATHAHRQTQTHARSTTPSGHPQTCTLKGPRECHAQFNTSVSASVCLRVHARARTCERVHLLLAPPHTHVRNRLLADSCMRLGGRCS